MHRVCEKLSAEGKILIKSAASLSWVSLQFLFLIPKSTLFDKASSPALI
ncbi:hypothetical protein GMES_1143 [Paraglaciecola mesophila KMM 241]|uniref:Uncharacterized protein n=1 Tax=Paraglaciecola mesophila KMM 241 TaxID=1128912 RepID=K6YZ61_9ALTE|nr:hypothetical protein GMES_1143 [Paraglaciecola mesophila KMM 241]